MSAAWIGAWTRWGRDTSLCDVNFMSRIQLLNLFKSNFSIFSINLSEYISTIFINLTFSIDFCGIVWTLFTMAIVYICLLVATKFVWREIYHK